MIDAHFHDIRTNILIELNKATTKISVAVYWFTNHQLFELLIDKLNNKVELELITHNDSINNRASGIDFQRFIDKGGKFYFSLEDYPMHNKFCIIDNKVVISGSYNWTYFAEEKNNENIIIVRDDEELVKKFNTEFEKIKESLGIVRSVKEVSNSDPFRKENREYQDMVAADMALQAKVTGDTDLVKKALNESPKSSVIQEIALELKATSRFRLKESIGYINSFTKRIINIFEKDSLAPKENSLTPTNSRDNQVSGIIELVLYNKESNKIIKSLGRFKVTKLNPRPKGKTKIRLIAKISNEGILYIEVYIYDSCETIKENWDIKEYLILE